MNVSCVLVNGKRCRVDPPVVVKPGQRVEATVSADGKTVTLWVTDASTNEGGER